MEATSRAKRLAVAQVFGVAFVSRINQYQTDLDAWLKSTCPLCLEPINYLHLAVSGCCRQAFHYLCLTPYINAHATCPMCWVRPPHWLHNISADDRFSISGLGQGS